MFHAAFIAVDYDGDNIEAAFQFAIVSVEIGIGGSLQEPLLFLCYENIGFPEKAG